MWRISKCDVGVMQTMQPAAPQAPQYPHQMQPPAYPQAFPRPAMPPPQPFGGLPPPPRMPGMPCALHPVYGRIASMSIVLWHAPQNMLSTLSGNFTYCLCCLILDCLSRPGQYILTTPGGTFHPTLLPECGLATCSF